MTLGASGSLEGCTALKSKGYLLLCGAMPAMRDMQNLFSPRRKRDGYVNRGGSVGGNRA